jgi:hypothetical protein
MGYYRVVRKIIDQSAGELPVNVIIHGQDDYLNKFGSSIEKVKEPNPKEKLNVIEVVPLRKIKAKRQTIVSDKMQKVTRNKGIRTSNNLD